MKLVSVIIPFHDGIGLLETCLGALAQQTYPRDRTEVLAIDNGTRADLRTLQARFPGVRWLSEAQPGSYVARNRGLAEARGEIVAFTDSDCRPARTWIARGVQALESSGATLVGGRVDYLDPGRPLNTCEHFEEMVFLLGKQRTLVEQRNIAATANLFTYRAVIDRVGPFDPKLTTFGDGAWTMGAVAKGETLRYADDVVVEHPRRSTPREILKKARRVSVGRLIQLKKQKAPWAARARELWRQSLLDPALHRLAFTRSGVPRQQRLKLLFAFQLVSAVCTWEKVKVLCGGRAFRG